MRLLLTALILALAPVHAFAAIEIIHVECNPVGSDAIGEFIKIKNTGTESVDLTGWKFNDGSNHILNAPPKNGGKGSMLIAPGEVAMLANKAGEVSGESTIIDTVMSLSNSGDTVKLLDAAGTEQASVSYTAEQVVEGGSCISYTANGSGSTGSDSATGVSTVVNTVTEFRTVELQPPQDIFVRLPKSIDGILGGFISISPEIYDATGKAVSEVACYITFGDASTTTKCSAEHIYDYPGDYIATVTVSQGMLTDSSGIRVHIAEPMLYITVPESKEYIELHNAADASVELNGWYIVVGHKRFAIPAGTTVPALGSIKISQGTMRINIARAGSTIELRNVFNKRVDYEPPASQSIIEPPLEASTELPSPPATQALAGSVSTPSSDIELKPIKTSVNKEASVIGVPVEDSPQQVLTAPELQVATAVVVAPEPASAATEYAPWLFGVLAISILALLPLLVRGRSDIAKETPVESKEVPEGFIIKELT